MKLTDINKKATPKNINKIMESRFGCSIDFDNLSVGKAKKILKSLNENMTKIHKSHGIHVAERSQKYTELLVIKEGLNSWLQLNESELGLAEVVLAAKDIVDSLQTMIKKASEIQNEQLPPLFDAIYDQLGKDQAMGFRDIITPAIQNLTQVLNDVREQAYSGSRFLAGEDVGMGMQMPSDGEVSPSPEDDLDQDMGGDEGDGFAATDAAAGGEEPLGRERR